MSHNSSEISDLGSYGIRAVDRVCDILELLGTSAEAVSLPAVAAFCRLPKSSTFRYLSTLEARQFVERTSSPPAYRLGPKLATLRAGHLELLQQRMEPILELIREEFDETANLGILDGREVAYLKILESSRSVRLAARANDRDGLPRTALGKAILASMDEERAHSLVGDSFPSKTPATITTWVGLLPELERIRAQGYAIDNEENELGGRCVAVKVPGVDAAISLSGPEGRMTPEVVAAAAARMIGLVSSN